MHHFWLASVNKISRFLKCTNYKHEKRFSTMLYFSTLVKTSFGGLNFMKTAITSEERSWNSEIFQKNFQANHISRLKGTIRLEVPNFTMRLEVPSAWCPVPKIFFSCMLFLWMPGKDLTMKFFILLFPSLETCFLARALSVYYYRKAITCWGT